MIIMKDLKERSFFSEDIPEQFYVVTDIKYNIELNDIKKGVLGVTGISGSAHIVLDFMGVARDLIIAMDGEELVNLNQITRIMYDNPHYLVSNNMLALSRIFQARPDDFQHTLRNVFDYMRLFMKKSSNSSYDDLYYWWDYAGIPDFEFSKAFKKMNLKIDNLSDFVRTLVEASKSIDEYNGKEYFENLSYKELYKAVEEALFYIGQTYKNEAEWVLKNKKLIIPSSTKFIIGIENLEEYHNWRKGELDPSKKFFMGTEIERWEIVDQFIAVIGNKGYPYSFMDVNDFRKAQAVILSSQDTDRVDRLLSKYPELKI